MKQTAPALGAEGWFTSDPPTLVGQRCGLCATVAFPPTRHHCPNPGCDGTADDLTAAPLGATGTVWSYTDARYAPPPPYVSRTDPYEPFTLAAVELDGAGLVVLGQLADGLGLADVAIGQRVELAVEPLFEDDDTVHTMWRWRPVPGPAGAAGAAGGDDDGR